MRILHTAIKMTLVGVIAALIAYGLRIPQFLTTGTLAILSISTTKKDSLDIGIKRWINGLIAVGLAWGLFELFGYDYWVLIVFSIIFISVSLVTRMSEGIVPSLVVATQVFTLARFSFLDLWQIIGILSIAIVISLVINFIYPQFWLKEITKKLKEVDEMIKNHLYVLTFMLVNVEDQKDFLKHYQHLHEQISKRIAEVEQKDKDKMFSNDHRFLAYVYMRKTQFENINQMYASAKRLKTIYEHNEIIANYLRQLIDEFGYKDQTEKQYDDLKKLTQNFEKESLPKTRSEFETRAMLYQIINDIESLLNAKRSFHQQYKGFELKIGI